MSKVESGKWEVGRTRKRWGYHFPLPTSHFTAPLGFASVAIVLALLGSPSLAAEPPKVVAARLGIGDAYQVGAWAPLRVTIEGGEAPLAVSVMTLTPDSDGVGVATTAPGGRPVSTEPGKRTEDQLYVRIGQQNAPIEVRLYADGNEVGRQVFHVGNGDPEKLATGEELPFPVGATDRLVLQVGGDLAPGSDLDQAPPDGVVTSWASVRDASSLPRDALGYDGFDTVFLIAGAAAGAPGGGWLGDLSPSDPRMRALVEWVENGGRLVVSCGAGGATLFASGGALANLLPGNYDGPGTISIATGVERFADDTEAGAIDFTGKTLSISKLTDIEGEVLASASGSGSEAPLIVQAPRGFGEVTFVAFDLDATAIAGWKGRTTLVRRLAAAPVGPRSDNGQRYYGFSGETDVVNSLLARLDSEFTGIRTAPFLAIVGLVVLYLLLIGPGDYFFVKHVLKKVEATWVTFPLLVIATSAAAYAGAYWLKGDRLRVNSLEVIDIDTAAGRARGALLTHLFSPRAERYALKLAPQQLNGEPLTPESLSTAWLGKPGYGLGGMRSRGASGSTGVRLGYQLEATPLLSPGGPEVIGMPVQVWSTKTLLSRYAGPTRSVIDAQLKPDRDGLVEGTLTNDTGARLIDCRLLYGTWAWKLGNLGDGETTTVDPSVSPLKITTLLAPIATRNEDYYRPIEGSVDVLADALSVGSLASEGTARANRCLHDLDLGRQLASGRALLLARLDDGPRSELARPDGPLIAADDAVQPEGPARRSWVAVRFILPVGE